MKSDILNNKTNSITRLFFKINWSIYFFLTLLCILGGVILYSVSGGNFHPLVSSHLIKYLISSLALFFCCFISINVLYKSSYVIYAFSIILLIAVLILGNNDFGANRWLYLAGFTFQPSEFSKISLIVILARYYNDYQLINNNNFLKILFPVFVIILPIILIINQPDLGTALMILVSSLSVVFLSGIGLPYIVISIIFFSLLTPLLWSSLYEYQKLRIITFLNPENDPLGSGYHIIQSQIAIGSGGTFGKGWMKGTQSHLDFLPEKHTDFIFSMLGEEFGFFGTISVIGLIVLITYLTYQIVNNSKIDTFQRILGFGIISNFFFAALINMSMVIGILPIVGLPLPLVSYGGSSMLTYFIGFGLILSIKLGVDRKY